MSLGEREHDFSLEALIARYLGAETESPNVDRDALIEKHPHLEDSLRAFFDNHDRLKAAASLDRDSIHTDHTPPVDSLITPKTSSCHEPSGAPMLSASLNHPPKSPPRQALTSSDEITVGHQIQYFGDYELLEEIARGGMGIVYKARQINLNRIVAIKMILAGQFAGQEDIQRFYTEAEAAAQLNHPGIVPIYEIGEHDRQHYFSMGYVEGKSLASKVADGPLPPQEAADIVNQICDAMAFAHERGVIHRDLKPANILIDSSGQPKVTDFGLAKRTEADSNLTGTGQILGTPAYMPPEQASGATDAIGPLADIYSIGAILYCLLTGRPPFQAASPMDTILQVIEKEPVPPRQLDPSIPVDLETICLKCLSKDTKQRYQSSTSLKQDIGRFIDGRPILSRPVGRIERSVRWCKRNPVVALLSAIAALLLLGGTLGISYFGVEARREATNAQLAQAIAEDRAAEASAATIRADANAREADNQRAEAIRVAKQLRRTLYVSDINRAFRALNEGHMELLDKLLRRQIPSAGEDDIRGTEFYHLQHELNRFLDQKTFDHGRAIASFTVSPSGESLVTLGFDNLIKVWDVATASLSKQLPLDETHPNDFFHERPTHVVRFSSDGTSVGVFAEGLLKLYEMPSWRLVHTKRIPGSIEAVEFSPNLREIAVIFTQQPGATLISTHDDQRVELPNPTNELATNGALDFSASAKLLAASRGIETTLWDLATTDVISTIDIPQKLWSYTVAMDEDAGLLARHRGGRGDHVVELIDLATHHIHSTLPASGELLRTVKFSRDASLVACAGDDAIVHLFDVANRTEVAQFKGHSGLIRELAFHPTQLSVFSASVDGTVREWQIRHVTNKMQGLTEQYPVELACSSDGAILQLKTEGKTRADERKLVYRWNLATEEAIALDDAEISFYTNSNAKFASRNGRYKASRNGLTLRLTDERDAEGRTRDLQGHRGRILDWAFAPDSRTLASIAGREIKLWNLATGEELATIDVGTRPLKLVYAPDGTLITADDDSKIHVFRTSVESPTP